MAEREMREVCGMFAEAFSLVTGKEERFWGEVREREPGEERVNRGQLNATCDLAELSMPSLHVRNIPQFDIDGNLQRVKRTPAGEKKNRPQVRYTCETFHLTSM
ncbi:hypothetical protein AMTR_s00149p00045640 [Amborella trichopoda]|uniref:Uncharacterized protein n=1 Tax=Amborella trichopoda TaxID=13333 RepID=W1PN97_AMBTC|nr:hypothetical protein AMTR_s00149p00045640 [Amborella trichopoda]